MKYISLIVAFLWALPHAYSQYHSKCNDAIPVSTSFYGPVTPEGWADSSLCVHNDPIMYFGKKHLVVWFSFIVPYDTTLTFQIIPQNPTDDFDFMLFKADRGDFCQLEKRRKIKPIRTNFAKPTVYSKGITGLSAKASEAYVPPGYNSPNSSAVQVKKGEWYYIAVDNYIHDKGGFTSKLNLRFNATEPISTIDAVPIKAPPIVTPDAPNFYLHVLDSTNNSIKASLIIDGIKPGKPIKADTADYSLLLSTDQTIKIRANAPGYMPYQSSYSVTSDTATATFWVHLEPIKRARKVTLKDIEFGENSPAILPTSRPALEYILQFLVSNPNVKIIIKGYANDPKHEQSEANDKALSEKRATSVKNYFIAHKVDKMRMTCIGYGSSKMIYPHPKNFDQEAANRRVEIEIQ